MVCVQLRRQGHLLLPRRLHGRGALNRLRLLAGQGAEGKHLHDRRLAGRRVRHSRSSPRRRPTERHRAEHTVHGRLPRLLPGRLLACIYGARHAAEALDERRRDVQVPVLLRHEEPRHARNLPRNVGYGTARPRMSAAHQLRALQQLQVRGEALRREPGVPARDARRLVQRLHGLLQGSFEEH